MLDPRRRWARKGGRLSSGTPCGHQSQELGIPGPSRTRREIFSGDSVLYIPSQSDVTPNSAK